MKLPVLKAFAAALAYFFTHILTIVRILWLPLLLMIAATVYVMPDYLQSAMAASALEGEPDPAQALSLVGSMLATMGLLLLVAAIAYPMMISGLLRHIVRGESPSLPFYLRYGADEFRILLTFILLIIMIMIVYIVGAIGVFAVTAALVAISPKVGGAIAGLVAIALVVALIWFLLRMSLAFPATIGARKIGIAESWRVTKGNAWRLLFYWILWVIVFLIGGCIFLVLALPQYAGLLGEMMGAATDPSAMREIERRMMEMQLAMWDMSKPGFWVYIAGNYIGTMLYLGLTYAASGVAYRYLAGEK